METENKEKMPVALTLKFTELQMRNGTDVTVQAP